MGKLAFRALRVQKKTGGGKSAVKPSASRLATPRPDFSATAELTWPELGTLGESEERARGALKDAPAGRRTLGAPGLGQSAASCGRGAQHNPRLGGPHMLPTAAAQVAGKQPAYPSVPA